MPNADRVARGAAWILWVAVIYLILASGMDNSGVPVPSLGNIGFTVVFVSFALVHCWASAGWRRTGVFFAAAAVVSFLLEEIGVRTGLVYGLYHYSDMLGPKLGHVPVLIPLAWFMMIYPSWMVARALVRGIDTSRPVAIAVQALVAALIMTGWDAVMDPGMAAGGNWVWERGGPYFGVPLRNYIGWILTTFLVYCIAGLLWRQERRPSREGAGFAALPVYVYACYAVSYITPRPIPALQIVAVFAMGAPAMLALAHLWLAASAAPSPRELRREEGLAA